MFDLGQEFSSRKLAACHKITANGFELGPVEGNRALSNKDTRWARGEFRAAEIGREIFGANLHRNGTARPDHPPFES